MNLVRKYKLYKFFDEPLDDKELEIINFIKGWFTDLTIFKIDKNSYFTYYMKDNMCLFMKQHENDNPWFRMDNFWCVLESHYSIDFLNIQNILKYLLEEKLKEKINTPQYMGRGNFNLIEEVYKRHING